MQIVQLQSLSSPLHPLPRCLSPLGWVLGINVECQANEETSNCRHRTNRTEHELLSLPPTHNMEIGIRKMRYLMWITPLWPQCGKYTVAPRSSHKC